MSKIADDGLTRSDTGCFYSCTDMVTVGVKWLISQTPSKNYQVQPYARASQ